MTRINTRLQRNQAPLLPRSKDGLMFRDKMVLGTRSGDAVLYSEANDVVLQAAEDTGYVHAKNELVVHDGIVARGPVRAPALDMPIAEAEMRVEMALEFHNGAYVLMGYFYPEPDDTAAAGDDNWYKKAV